MPTLPFVLFVPPCYVPTVPLVPLWFVPLVPGVALVPPWFVPTVPSIPPVPPWSVPTELPGQSCSGFGSSSAVDAGPGPARPPPPLLSPNAMGGETIHNKPRYAFPRFLRKATHRVVLQNDRRRQARRRAGGGPSRRRPLAAEVPVPAERRDPAPWSMGTGRHFRDRFVHNLWPAARRAIIVWG